MKIIILIISNQASHYNQMKEMWKKYMNKHENIKCFFIEFNIVINQQILLDETNNTIYIKGNETYIPGILDKTIKSIQYIVSQNIEFDYILRTNLSTFIALDKLYNYLLKITLDYAGPKTKLPIKTRFKKYLNLISSDNRYYASGTCIIMSNECVKYLLEQEINYNLIDDLSIGFTLSKKYKLYDIIRTDCVIDNGINLDYNNAINYNNENDFVNPDKFIFRCKHINSDLTLTMLNNFISLYFQK